MRPHMQKQPQVKKEPCRVLDDVDVDDFRKKYFTVALMNLFDKTKILIECYCTETKEFLFFQNNKQRREKPTFLSLFVVVVVLLIIIIFIQK